MSTQPKDSKSPDFPSLYKIFSKRYPSHLDVKFVPSGSVILDLLMGGGIPLGKLIEFYSDAGVGKTLIALALCRGLMETTDYCALYIDSERAVTDGLLDGSLKENLGKRFTVMPVSTFEEVEEIINAFTKDPKLKLVVIDSITSVIPKDIIDKPIGEVRPGIKAQYQSMFCEKHKALADILQYSMVFVNQKRTKLNFKGISIVDAAGGLAMKFYMDIRFSVRTVKKLVDEEKNSVGAQVEVKSIKNKIAGNIKSELLLRYGKGISNIGAYIYCLSKAGFVTQSGSVYFVRIPTLNIDEKFVGSVALSEYVEKNVKEIANFLVNSKLVISQMSEEEVVEALKEDES